VKGSEMESLVGGRLHFDHRRPHQKFLEGESRSLPDMDPVFAPAGLRTIVYKGNRKQQQKTVAQIAKLSEYLERK
jgi:hypothetical protein